jgi:alkanesulfonate monooxygenase SsuD/methylene tetrahydromethanopterin reductase-like flavin-dependent oxidoreductase (luciferase family)
MVYHSTISDHWIKAAHVLDQNQKIKYMPAIRTYAITPEYCAMICRAFNEIDPNRLMLNIVTGDLKNDETSIEDLIYINNLMNTSEKRLNYTEEWIKRFRSMDIAGGFPEIVMSGHSEKTNELASLYAEYHLSSNSHQHNFVGKRNIISTAIVIRDTEEEAKEYVDSLPYSSGVTIWGTEDSVLNKLSSMANDKVTDFMLQGHFEDKENWDRIHSMSKKILGRSNASI